jgi:hypothetical protein
VRYVRREPGEDVDVQEWYERGTRDAERGDPDAFLYQHYYHYRLGYDDGRRRIGRPSGMPLLEQAWVRVGIPVVVVVVLTVAALARFVRIPDVASVIDPTATARPAQSNALPVNTPIFPTATRVIPTATTAILRLRIGGWAIVQNTEGRPLRGRIEPGLTAAAIYAYQEREVLQIVDGPVRADGYVWWQVSGASGTGWSAERSLEDVVWLAATEAPTVMSTPEPPTATP